ncbi:MAG: phosphomannomutase/phosphoglucomutase, partial [Synechococcales cyanobacterium]
MTHELNWKKLQNGSDIRGVALEGVTGEPINLSPEVVYRLGQAFGHWLATETGKQGEGLRVSVGRDSRISGPRLMQAFMEGLVSLGVKVY